MRYALEHFARGQAEVSYVVIGRKGREMLVRRRGALRAEFTGLPAEPVFADVSAIGRLAVDDFLGGRFDQVHVVYTDYVNLLKQVPTGGQAAAARAGNGRRTRGGLRRPRPSRLGLYLRAG